MAHAYPFEATAFETPEADRAEQEVPTAAGPAGADEPIDVPMADLEPEAPREDAFEQSLSVPGGDDRYDEP